MWSCNMFLLPDWNHILQSMVTTVYCTLGVECFISWGLHISRCLEASGSQGLPSMYPLSIFITPSSSLQISPCVIVKIKHIWLHFLEILYLHRLNLIWSVYHGYERKRECVCECGWMNLSLHSPAPHLFPETKTSFWAVSRKKQANPAVG